MVFPNGNWGAQPGTITGSRLRTDGPTRTTMTPELLKILDDNPDIERHLEALGLPPPADRPPPVPLPPDERQAVREDAVRDWDDD